MVSRKRGRDQVEAEEPVAEVTEMEEPSTIQKIRAMWEFASLLQYLFFFGKAVKLDDLDVEDIEDECLKPTTSEKLKQTGLALLKFVSSHKGLTPEIFDEYARRQYVAKAPKRNPFGIEDVPNDFNEFDVFTKIRVLHQLSVWTLNNPNPIRERLDERESEEVNWRIEPFGWDRDDRVYFVLDDNRLYRRTDAPPPPEETPKPKVKAKKGGRSTRSNKRRRVSRTIPETSPEDEDETMQETDAAAQAENGNIEEEKVERPDDFFMQKWELIAVTLDEYNNFIDTIRKSKDPNEKSLVKSIQEHVFPILAEQEEERKRKEERRMKELEMLQKLASSKRSSRLAGKQEKIKEQQEAEEAERRHQEELEMAHREQRRQQELEHARESRRETREQRLKEREVKRILEEERLKKEEELLRKKEAGELDAEEQRARLSERKLKADMEKRKRDLENLQQDDDWYFDCSKCGVHGDNLDDGTHSIACEKCSVWQHSACHGISEQQAEREDFHFLCNDCKKKAANPIPPIKLKFGASPTSKMADGVHVGSNGVGQPGPAPRPGSSKSPSMNGNGHSASPSASLVYPGPPPKPPAGALGLPPVASMSPSVPRPTSSGTMNGGSQLQWQQHAIPPSPSRYSINGAPAYNGYYHPPPPPNQLYGSQPLQARPVSQEPYVRVSPPQQYQAPANPRPYGPPHQAPHPPIPYVPRQQALPNSQPSVPLRQAPTHPQPYIPPQAAPYQYSPPKQLSSPQAQPPVTYPHQPVPAPQLQQPHQSSASSVSPPVVHPNQSPPALPMQQPHQNTSPSVPPPHLDYRT